MYLVWSLISYSVNLFEAPFDVGGVAPSRARFRRLQADKAEAGSAAIKTTTPRRLRGAAARCTAAGRRAPRLPRLLLGDRPAAARLLSSDWLRRASTGGCPVFEEEEVGGCKMAAGEAAGRYRSTMSKSKDPSGLLISVIR